MSARNPSHLGSKIQLSPAGKSSTRLASIGKTGGFTGRFTLPFIASETDSPRAQYDGPVLTKTILCALAIAPLALPADSYFPLPDAKGGWCTLADAAAIQKTAGLDKEKL